MELAVQIQGVDALVRNLTGLGTKKIPVFVATALTTLADTVQDALIAHTRLRLTVRGRWLIKGYRYGINRYRARANHLEAEVWTQAPWLIELASTLLSFCGTDDFQVTFWPSLLMFKFSPLRIVGKTAVDNLMAHLEIIRPNITLLCHFYLLFGV